MMAMANSTRKCRSGYVARLPWPRGLAQLDLPLMVFLLDRRLPRDRCDKSWPESEFFRGEHLRKSVFTRFINDKRINLTMDP